MIGLAKLPIPRVLEENWEAWTQVVVQSRAQGREVADEDRYRYRHPTIKQTLIEETSGKCAYCESKLLHVTNGDIEHVTPKSIEPELWFSWDNLTIACVKCNQHKGTYHNPQLPLVDPYEGEPGDHIWFYGPMAVHVRGSDRGRATVHRLKLNRIKLVEQRTERLQAIVKMLDAYDNMPAGPMKELLWDEILCELESEKEYAAMSRAFIEARRAPAEAELA